MSLGKFLESREASGGQGTGLSVDELQALKNALT
jgi:hypothetical protein